MPARTSPAGRNWIARLSEQADAHARRQLLLRKSRANPRELADRLYDEVVRLTRVDMRRAERVAEALAWLAEQQPEAYVRAQSLRAFGHVLYLTGNYRSAGQKHQAALRIFDRLGLDLQVGRTINGMIQPLIYLGRYERAFALVERAREIFRKQGDRLRQAYLDSNVGNILHRLDRFTEALDHYGRAYRVFMELDDTANAPTALHNMAICQISLNRFDDALRTYSGARDYWQQQGKPLLVAQADYNIAYLYYLRGEYTRAIELYQHTRLLYEKLGDRYHTALCDLDQSEMYVELNLSEEAGDLARRAFAGFQKLGMNYEVAKALAFQAMAARQQGRPTEALETFDHARQLFQRETNRAWPALIDIHKALVLMEQGDRKKARRLCESALLYFRSSDLVGKAALCELLLARLDLQDGHLRRAKSHCQAAFRRLAKGEAPVVEFQAHATMGQVQEASGDPGAAYQSYKRAHDRLEGLRSHLLGEEFKIAFLKDKLSVYESLVLLSLARRRAGGREAAFHFIERAKSRSLADLIAFQVSALQPRVGHDPQLAARLCELEEKLTSAYHQARREELQAEEASAERLQRLRRASRSYESEFSAVLSGIGSADQEFASLLSAGTAPLDAIRSAIPAGALLLEYYVARGTVYACILGSDRLEVLPLAAADPVRSTLRLLQFQLSKFRLGEQYVRRFSETLHAATQTHLRELHGALIAPLRNKLHAQHLIVVPHGFLHYLPFHALWDGDRWLVDEFSLSYAPSASVYYLCASRKTVLPRESLVLGIPDPLAPYILDEARTVAAALPGARLFLGDQATHELLREYAPSSRFVHIATHGLFRRDNPMFSSIRLGKSDLNLFDLYQLRLSSELVTLSGCGTGLNVVVGGDELLGLVRGLLFAGSQAVLVTLWDVNDESASEFMKSFYRRLPNVPSKAVAIQQAMQELRLRYPHPYHWAPFVLIGRFEGMGDSRGSSDGAVSN